MGHRHTPSFDALRQLKAALASGVTEVELCLAPPFDERTDPLHPLEDRLVGSLAHLADALDATGAFRVLHRLVPDVLDTSAVARQPGIAVGVIVDVETTGLDHRRDEVIELGMLRFEHRDGEVLRVTGAMSALREPGVPISPEITRLTGIAPEMVAGQSIHSEAVVDILDDVDLVIAHNAGFDRPFCEALNLGFANLPWACSVDEVDWAAAGFEGAKLGYLLLQAGRFHDGHRALDDCRALLHLLRLGRWDGESGEDVPLLSDLVASASETRFRIWAEGAPFHQKHLLKARGYRWFPGSHSARKAWWRDVTKEGYRDEVIYLQDAVYGCCPSLRTERLTARDRYRAR